MRYAILAGAAASLLLSGAAMAQPYNQEPAIQGGAIDYGETPNGANLNTTQPSGGYADDSLSAPTGNLAGAPMGAANMNGPNRNGQPLDIYLQNGDSPEINGR